MSLKRKVPDPNIFRIASLFFEGWKVRDIAEKLGLSREAVYPLLGAPGSRGTSVWFPPSRKPSRPKLKENSTFLVTISGLSTWTALEVAIMWPLWRPKLSWT